MREMIPENGLRFSGSRIHKETNWEPDPEHPLAYINGLEFENGQGTFFRLECPQMYIEDEKTSSAAYLPVPPGR